MALMVDMVAGVAETGYIAVALFVCLLYGKTAEKNWSLFYTGKIKGRVVFTRRCLRELLHS